METRMLDLLSTIRDILTQNDRPILAAKVDSLIEMHRSSDERFDDELISGFFRGASGSNDSAPLWGVHCRHREREFWQAIVDLEIAMKEEGIQHQLAKKVAGICRSRLNGDLEEGG